MKPEESRWKIEVNNELKSLTATLDETGLGTIDDAATIMTGIAAGRRYVVPSPGLLAKMAKDALAKGSKPRMKWQPIETATKDGTEILTDHHDGLGLNDLIGIVASDEDAMGVSHHFKFERQVPEGLNLSGFIQFQKGPRNVEGSTPGVTTDSVLTMLIHHLRGFQNGPFKSRETACMITHLEEALHWSQARARERARRGVLGQAKA